MQLLNRYLLCAAGVAMAVLWLTAGCEKNNSDTEGTTDTGVEFRIDPSAFNMGTNITQVTLTVVGGITPFAWSMSAPAMGALSGNDGISRVVTYTAAANQVGVNTVRVQDSQGWIASSAIVQGQ
jgi:hypothetical protein